jgi:hypothetical protein
MGVKIESSAGHSLRIVGASASEAHSCRIAYRKIGSAAVIVSCAQISRHDGLDCHKGTVAGLYYSLEVSTEGAPSAATGASADIFARCSFRMAFRDSLMRLPSTASTFTRT